MYLVQTIIRARPLCDEYKKYTLIEWERCVFAKCRAPLKNATQCLSPRLSSVEKNSGGEEGTMILAQQRSNHAPEQRPC